jgi:hypothetical protein
MQPKRIWVPKATSTAMPDWRCPRIWPKFSLRGKVREDQLAMANCPMTLNTIAATVATRTGSEGNPTS